MKYFLFECHYGDDNDNHIADIVVKAETKDEAIDKLEAINKKDGYESNGGDENLIDGMNYEGDRPLHQDFHFQSEHDTEEEADNEKQHYHADWGTLDENAD